MVVSIVASPPGSTPASKPKERCWHAATSRASAALKWCDARTPLLLDLVGDSARSRVLTLLLVALILLWIVRSALFVVFLADPISPQTPPVFTLELPQQQLGAINKVEGGETFGETLAVTVRAVVGTVPVGACAEAVQLELRPIGFERAWQEQFRLQGTLADASGVPVGGGYSLSGLPPRALLKPVFVGTAATPASDGVASFPNLRMVSGLPGTYSVTARYNNTEVVLSQVLVTSSVANVTVQVDDFLNAATGSPVQVPIGGTLPTLRVAIFDVNGARLSGKTAILVSAPLDAAEFSVARDFLPRAASLAGGASPKGDGATGGPHGAVFSTPSDSEGVAVFRNVVLTGASGTSARFVVVVEGVLGTTPTGDAAAPLTLAVAPPGGGARVRLTVLTQPPASALEGTVFAQQPSVRVETLGARGWEPSPAGVVVFAHPHRQAGFSAQSPLSPSGAAELGITAGSSDAVLGNLGRTKAFTGSASLPTDANGLAKWETLGTIAHGPKGEYSVGFWLCGAFVESAPVSVSTSVASVEWIQPLDAAFSHSGTASWADKQFTLAWQHFNGEGAALPEGALWDGVSPGAIGAVMCSWPTCSFQEPLSSASLGFFQYSNASFPSPGEIPELPHGPSGMLTAPPILLIRNSAGELLAGKAAVPIVSGASTVVAEFPFTGAAVSKLEVPSYAAAGDADEATLLSTPPSTENSASQPTPLPMPGTLVYLQHNLEFARGKDPRLLYATATGDYGAMLRVVTAPLGYSVSELSFSVEGILTSTTALHVWNLNGQGAPAPAIPHSKMCAHLNITSSPDSISGNGSGTFSSPLVVLAVNDNGEPVPTPNVSIFVVDALGTFIVKDSTGYPSVPSPSLTRYLQQMGGAGGLGVGSLIASALQGIALPSALAQQDTDASGRAAFDALPGFRAFQRTWVRFAAVALYPTLTDAQVGSDKAHSFFTTTACASQYSEPVEVVLSGPSGDVGTIAWSSTAAYVAVFNATSGNAISSLVDPPLPPIVVTDTNGEPLVDVPVELRLISDGSLTQVPSGYGSLVPAPLSISEFQQIFFAHYFSSFPPFKPIFAPFSDVDRLANAAQDAFYVPALVNPLVSSSLYVSPSNISAPWDGVDAQASTSSSGTVTFNCAAPPGSAGNWTLVATSGGSFSAPVKVSVEDGINVIAVHDWPTDGSVCPGNVSVVSISVPLDSEFLEELPAIPSPCPNGCSGHGVCVCGVCVCSDGWDGAGDCGVKFDEDLVVPYFQDAPFRGLAVYDIRAASTSSRNASYYGELFPRLLLARTLTPGWLANPVAELEASLKLAAKAIPTMSVPQPVVVNDYANYVLLGGASKYLNSSLLLWTPVDEAVRRLYTIFPVLETCRGDPVYGWAFSHPSRGGCVADAVPVYTGTPRLGFSGPAPPADTSDFAAFVARVLGDKPDDPFKYLEPRLDHRILLVGVPTGCYRFSYSYAPRSGGNLVAHSIDNVADAQAVSLGRSRPFRVLSPVLKLEVQAADAAAVAFVFLPRDAPIPFAINVTLRIRKGDSDAPFTDICSDSNDNFAKRNPGLPPQLIPYRCPATPAGGLEVFATAVSVSNPSIEYSLFLPSREVDCARTTAVTSQVPYDGSDGYTYTASFTQLQFPSSPGAPPGPSSLTSSLAPPGQYHIKFSAYGVSEVFSEFIVNLVDQPNVLVGFERPSFLESISVVDSAMLLNGTHILDVGVGVDTEFPLFFLLVGVLVNGKDTELDYSWIAGGLISPTVLWGPQNSNIDLGRNWTVTAGTLLPTYVVSGASGIYALQFQTYNLTVLLGLRVNNPVSTVTLTWKGASPPTTPLRATATVPVEGALKVCAPGAPYGANVTFRLFRAPADPASQPPLSCIAAGTDQAADDPEWLTSLRAQSSVPLVRGGVSNRTIAALGLTYSVGGGDPALTSVPFGVDGCVSVSRLIFTTQVTQNVMLVASVSGVEALPLYFTVQSFDDAYPVSLSDLKSLIITPLLVVLPLFGANSHALSLPGRAVCLVAGLGCILWLGLVDGAGFIRGERELKGRFSPAAVSYVYALNVLYVGVLVLVGLLAAVAVSSIVPLVLCGATARAPAVWPKRDSACDVAQRLCADVEGGFSTRRQRAAAAYVRKLLRSPTAAAVLATEVSANAAAAVASIGDSDVASNNNPDVTSSTAANGASDNTVSIASNDAAMVDKPPPASRARACRRCLCTVVAWLPMEDSRAAFFFPQRLLVALVSSVVFCCLLAMIVISISTSLPGTLQADVQRVLSGSNRLGQEVQELKARLVSTLRQVLSQSKVYVQEQAVALNVASGQLQYPVGDTLVKVIELATQSFLTPSVCGAPPTSEFGDTAAALASQDSCALGAAAAGGVDSALASLAAVANGTGATLPPALLEIIANVQSNVAELHANSPGISTLIARFVTASQGVSNVWVAALEATLAQSAVAGVSVGFVFVVFQWVALLRAYRGIVLALRRGNALELPASFASQWRRDASKPGNAVSFVGLQAAGSLASFVLVTFSVTLTVFLLQLAAVQEFLRTWLPPVLIAWATTTLLLFLAKKLAVWLTVSGPDVRYRALFGLIDIVYTFLGVISGLFTTLLRLCILVGAIFVVLMRPDVFLLPRLALRLDPLSKAFAGLVAMDTQFANPVFAVAAEAFTARLLACRAARAAEAQVARVQAWDDGGADGIDAGVRATSKTPSKRLPPALSSSHLRGGGGDTTVVLSNPLSAHSHRARAAAATTEVSPRIVPVDALTTKLRARTRWHLAALLLRNPSLRAMRRRGAVEEVGVDADRNGGE